MYSTENSEGLGKFPFQILPSSKWFFDRGYMIDRSIGKPIGNFEINLNIGYKVENGRKENKVAIGSNEKNYLEYTSRTIPILFKVLYYYNLNTVKPFIGVGLGTSRINLDLQLSSNLAEMERLVQKFKPTLSYELGILFSVSDSVSVGIAIEELKIAKLTNTDLKDFYSEFSSKVEEINLKTEQKSVKFLIRILL